MIIPVRCFTCGKVLGDKWTYYERRVRETTSGEEDDVGGLRGGARSPGQRKRGQAKNDDSDDAGTKNKHGSHTVRGEILDEMGLTRLCCRRHMLSHVDLIDVI